MSTDPQSDSYSPGVRDALRAVLDAVDAGELTAESGQLAFLRGAVFALEHVTEPTG